VPFFTIFLTQCSFRLTANDGFSDYHVTVCVDGLSCGGCTQAGYCQENEFFSDCMGKFYQIEGGDWGNVGILRLKCNPQAENFLNIRGENYYKTISAESKYACPVAQECAVDDCTKCVQRSTCYWCLDNHKCLPTTSPCNSWTRVPQYCCAQYANCEDCSSRNCGWCSVKQRCIYGDDLTCGAIIRDPDFCDAKNTLIDGI